MASNAEVTIKVNEEIKRIAIESKLIIEQFQKLLGVHTTTEALAKIVVLMREDDTADRLLSKALGHLHSCSESGSNDLYQEIASAFGQSGRTPRALDAALWVCQNCGEASELSSQRCSVCNTPRQ